MKDLMILPSGRGINLDQIAYFTPDEGRLLLTFFPSVLGAERTEPLELDLQGEDAVVFLHEVRTRAITSVEPTAEAAGPG